MPITTISVNEYQQQRLRAGQGFSLVDVRSVGAFKGLHAETAQNVPLGDLNPADFLSQRQDDDNAVLLLCQMGGRAQQAAQQLVAERDGEWCVLDGRTNAWLRAGLPVVRGKGWLPLGACPE